jgi:hypothetical protein
MSALQISIRAQRYVDALHALQKARRSWQNLDAELVRLKKRRDFDIAPAWEELHRLDQAIARATHSLLMA